MKINTNLKTLDAEICRIEQANRRAVEHLGLVRAIVFSRFCRFFAGDFMVSFALDDLLSVGYLGLIKASRKWENRGVQKFSSFAYTVIVCDIYKYLRAERVKGRALSPFKADYDITVKRYNSEKFNYLDYFSGQSESEIDLSELERHLSRQALEKLIEMAKLTDKERIAVDMRLQQAKDEEIARILQIKRASARSTYHNGMKKLRSTALAINLATRLAA